MDLNHGRLPPTDLQSVAIDHSAIPPHSCFQSAFTYWSRQGDSNLRPADYKSAALPTELHRLQQVRHSTLRYAFCQAIRTNSNTSACSVTLILHFGSVFRSETNCSDVFSSDTMNTNIYLSLLVSVRASNMPETLPYADSAVMSIYLRILTEFRLSLVKYIPAGVFKH